jgi:hypothetical protein
MRQYFDIYTKNYSKLVKLARNGLIRTKDVSSAEIGRDYLRYAVEDGVIENIAPGIYLLKNEFEDRMFIFQLKNSKLIFSSYTSAYLLGLTTRVPMFFLFRPPWVTTTQNCCIFTVL